MKKSILAALATVLALCAIVACPAIAAADSPVLVAHQSIQQTKVAAIEARDVNVQAPAIAMRSADPAPASDDDRMAMRGVLIAGVVAIMLIDVRSARAAPRTPPPTA